MKISSRNIDKWLFDYYEGNLTEEQMQELDLYCLLNPEADAEKMAWEQAYMKEDSVPVFEDKDDLIVAPFWTADKVVFAALLLLLLPTITLFVVQPFAVSGIHGKDIAKLRKFDSIENTGSVSANKVESSYIAEAIDKAEEAKTSLGQGAIQDTETAYATSDPVNKTNGSNDVHHQLAQKADVLVKAEAFRKQANTGTYSSSAIIHEDISEPVALYQELDKYQDGAVDHTGKIADNPEYQGEDLNLVRNLKELDLKKSSFSIGFRRFFKRLFRHEVALSNLRDPNVIVPDFQLMNYNASFAGSVWASRFDARYRTRWLGDDQFMHRATFSYDTYMPGLKGGLGIVANFNDFGNGAYQDYNLSVIYSPKLQVAKEIFIEPSLKLTMGAHAANSDKSSLNTIEWSRGFVVDHVEQSSLQGSNYGFYQDLGAGLMINTKWFYIGAMFDNLARHRLEIFSDNENVVRMPKRYSAVIATDYQSEQNERFVVSPFVAYENFGSINELWAGSHLRWNGFLFGASMSTDLNFKGQIGFQAKGFKMSYSYDQTDSFVHDRKIGSHSILLRVNMNQFNNSKRRRY